MTLPQAIPPYRVTITKVRMMMYAAATWNPYQLHWDSEFSRGRGFADANVAGPMIGDYLAEMLVRWTGNPARLKTLDYTNRDMAFPGDTLTFRGEVLASATREGLNVWVCRVWVENQAGRVIAEGRCTIDPT